jgi:hypothetical protein
MVSQPVREVLEMADVILITLQIPGSIDPRLCRDARAVTVRLILRVRESDCWWKAIKGPADKDGRTGIRTVGGSVVIMARSSTALFTIRLTPIRNPCCTHDL